ncbi:replication protein Rep, partial [Staphylococcus epidermidis]
KQRQYINREKTPEWLNEGRLGQSQEIHNEDTKLKQDREAFQRQLEEKWEY